MAELDASLAFRRENRGKFRIFHAVARMNPPLGFRSHRMKSLGRNSSTNTFHIFPPHAPPFPPPLPFLSLLEQPIHRMPILNLLPYAIFTREFVLVLADLLTVARSSFLNFGINLVFFSFMI